MTPTAEILRRAGKKIMDPKHWVQGAEATTAKGAHCDARDEGAECYCAMGAVIASTYELQVERGETGESDFFTSGETSALRILAYQIEQDTMNALRNGYTTVVISFNDDPSTTHAQVLDVFNNAVKWAERHYVE